MTSEVEVPGWATAVPNYPVHTEPARTGGDILPPFTWQQMQEYFAQFMNAFLAQVAIALGGIEIAGWKPFEFLVVWGENSLQTGDPLNAADLVGLIAEQLIPGLDATKIISGLFQQAQVAGSEAGTTLEDDLNDLWNSFTDAAGEFLTKLSPLNALNLFNLVPTDLLAHLSISNIGTAITNLLTDPDFLDAGAFSGLDTWFHDLTGGFDGTGAAYTIADGTTKELLGNLIPVSTGQVVPITGKVKWTGLAGTGNPIALAITGYQADGATVQATVASHNTTPPTTDWIDLSGDYTVPDNVTSLRTRLLVGSTATAGTVSFSKLSATKVGPLLQRLIAGTDPGEFLPDDIENLFTGIVTNATELLNKAGLTDFNELMATIGGDIGDDIAAVEERLNDFLGSLSPLNANNINQGNIADEFVGGIGTIIDNLVTNLFKIDGSGFGHTDASHALSSITQSLIDVSTRTAQLETTFTGGVSEGDDFERTSSTSLGSGWLQYYTGGGGVWATPNGHDASWIPSGVGDREFIAIRNTGIIRSSTDLQRVAKVMSAKATRFYDPILGTYDYCGHNDLWLRISDTTTSLANVTGIRIRFGGNGSVSIVRFVNGIPTTLNALPAGSIAAPAPGAQIVGTAGESGTARVFRAYIGVSMMLEIPEVGTASGLGAAFRRWGHGGRAEGHLLPFPGQESPGGCHQWTGMDLIS